MNKINYNRIMEKILSSLNPAGPKPKLLLHACCAPCSSHCLELLFKYFDITIYYYNPNIHPDTEYKRRLQELIDFLPRFDAARNVKLVQADYNPQEYFSAVNTQNEPELITQKEKGERCRRCYSLRMTKSYEYAKENGFDWFTTTLSISRHKDSEKINLIGKELECKDGPAYLYADFKKNGGYDRSLELSEEYNLYRQDYCGCVFSRDNSNI
ncbi:MAG: epoxyqueuosine reductase QueH [Treponema sp.]|nr:epoxyqueuosine reductase QueH [Treponema sp.]